MSNYQMSDPTTKYTPFSPIPLSERSWPSRSITQAPVWCSVDLRDGNQALPTPMSLEDRLEFFSLLVDMGFKQIEAGNPFASELDFAFIRRLIDENRIPDGVSLQVLTSCASDSISKTFLSIEGARQVILHFLNNTSPLQRRLVFHADEDATVALAVQAARQIRDLASQCREKGMHVDIEYTPVCFTETEPAFALRIVDCVLDALEATPSRPAIINLPASVEVCMPNQYADLVEWFSTSAKDRSRFILSVHPHNDRGTAIAATELALLAGAERVEGALFGNGERTGNADIITLALNLYTQGIHPGLAIGDIDRIRDACQRLNRCPVSPRHPYVGEYVYTALSEAHREAISQAVSNRKRRRLERWNVPYLPLDPSDVGRQYEPMIRVVSQKGQNSAAFVLENRFGYKVPKAMLPELNQVVNEAVEADEREISDDVLFSLFNTEFIRVETPYELASYHTSYLNEEDEEDNEVRFSGVINHHGQPTEVEGVGNGPIDALYHALKTIGAADYDFVSYDQHALSAGSDSRAIAYIQLKDKTGFARFGVGTSRDIKKASLRALISAINRMSRERE
ncbi:MAG: 2-isopropylmalate synthase [Clostridiales bacterium]|nr:2-isopropylmalate synthase [Clostridiales bacterium]